MDSPAVINPSIVTQTISREPLLYSLDQECPVPWPSHEDALNHEYPFHCINSESRHDVVVRQYLETLWLPESIMPLRHLVKFLFLSSSVRPEVLLEALRPLLLSVRAIEEKYHKELPHILQDGGGAADIEETMMWYSWRREKKIQPNGNGEDNDVSGKHDEDVAKKAWMEKLERREVQIQILFYFYLLSVSSPTQGTSVASPAKKRRKQIHRLPSPIKDMFPPTASVEAAAAGSLKSPTTDVDEDLGMEERLEFLMDRLSLWQLMDSLILSESSLAASSQPQAKDQRDWMQVFCEEVVEPLFRDRLPDLCDLLRTKVFPHSLFSEDSDSTSSPHPILPAKKSKTKRKRPPSPLRLQELGKPQAMRSHAGSTQPSVAPTDSKDSGASQRCRSRSRSVSVSVEEVRARGANRGGVASSKSLWKGEVEMKRTSSRGSKLFKPPPVDNQRGNAEKTTRQNSRSDSVPFKAQNHASHPRSASQARPRMLAADTPVKKSFKLEDTVPNIVIDSPELSLMSKLQWHGLDENNAETEEEGISMPLQTIFAADTPVKKAHT